MASQRTNPIQVGFTDEEYAVLHRAAKLRGISPAYFVYQSVRASLPSLLKAVEASEHADREIAGFMQRLVAA